MVGNGSGEGSSMTVGGDGMCVLKKGPWTAAEDAILMDYVKRNGEGNWNAVQKNSGLSRCGKSCRLRWANHLRPNLKKGSFTPEEERIILELHSKIGNKWARMATQLPGRTDNEIKNYWNTRIKRRQRSGLPLYPPDIQHRHNGFHHNLTRQSPLTLQTETEPQFGRGNPPPFSLFDSFPINFSTAPTMAVPIPPQPLMGHSLFPNSDPQPLFPRPHHLKRARDESLDYSTMFGTNIVSTAVPMLRFGSRPNGPNLQQQQHNLTHFSMKMELPSNQYLPAMASNHDSEPWVHHNNSGLLDALLEDTHGANRKISVEYIKRSDEKTGDDIDAAKMNMEPLGTGISESEDLSALFDFMTQTTMPIEASPPAAVVASWPKNESGETSNGQSSGVTEDDLGLDMHQLSSCIRIEGNEHHHHHHWNQWDNMSGIS